MIPSIGRIVHFHTSVATQAAIVTSVYSTPPDKVDLTVFAPGGAVISRFGVREGTSPGCWSEPPRIAQPDQAAAERVRAGG